MPRAHTELRIVPLPTSHTGQHHDSWGTGQNIQKDVMGISSGVNTDLSGPILQRPKILQVT